MSLGVPRGLPRRPLILVLSFALALVLAEGGVRGWLWLQGDPWSAAEGDRRVDEAVARIQGFREGLDAGDEKPLPEGARRPGGAEAYLAHPYFAYDTGGGEGGERLVQLLTAEDRREEVSVLLLGGSVAVLFVAGQDNVRKDFEARVAADPRAGGLPVRLYSHARPGFKQPQQLHALTEILRRGCRPDVVINLDGYNELQFGVRNQRLGLRADWPSDGHWALVGAGELGPEELEVLVESRLVQRRALARAESSRRWGLTRSAIAGTLVLQGLERDVARIQESVAAFAAQRLGTGSFRDFDPGMVEPVVELWRDSSRLMHELCRAHGIAYLHALQPTLHDRGSKPLTASERERGLRGGWKEAVVLGYPRLREVGAELSAEGLTFLDLSGVFAEVTEPLYYDPCHFRRPGNELVADPLAEAVLAALERP